MSEMSGHAGWLDGLLLLVPGFLNDSGLFGEHHGNIVANRVNAPARNAFQSGLVRKEFHPRFAQRANQDVESKFWNTQEFLLGMVCRPVSKRSEERRVGKECRYQRWPHD